MTELIYVSTKKYVYFNESGEIMSVGNSIDETGNYIEVEFNEVANLITGQEQLHQYQVIFDTVKKTYVLRHKFNDEEVVFDINSQIHKIPRLFNSNADLVVKQDLNKKMWIFSLNETIKENLKNKTLSVNKPLIFSFTRFNDPHQLEKFITIELNELVTKDVEIPFTTQIELDIFALSVYTIKRLETYYHEVIDEQ